MPSACGGSSAVLMTRKLDRIEALEATRPAHCPRQGKNAVPPARWYGMATYLRSVLSGDDHGYVGCLRHRRAHRCLASRTLRDSVDLPRTIAVYRRHGRHSRPADKPRQDSEARHLTRRVQTPRPLGAPPNAAGTGCGVSHSQPSGGMGTCSLRVVHGTTTIEKTQPQLKKRPGCFSLPAGSFLFATRCPRLIEAVSSARHGESVWPEGRERGPNSAQRARRRG